VGGPGPGLLDVAAAVDAVAGLAPVSRSFGNWSSGAGGSRRASIVVTNLSGSAQTSSAAVDDTAADGVTFSGSDTFTLAPGESRAVTITATAAKGAPDGHKFATLRISDGGSPLAHARLYTLVGEGDPAPGQHQLPPPFA